jgi:IclR family transcriptional regulator, pca regulon regulatory protein
LTTKTSEPKPAPNYRIEALAKGLRVLKLFSTARPTMRVKEIATAVGYPLPTVFRLVATLEDEGYLERTADGSVRPGTAVLTLGFAVLQDLDLAQTSELIIRDLADRTGESVNLGVLIGDQVLVVRRIQGRPTSLAANVHAGSQIPAVFSSMGKVLLSYLSEEDLSSRLTSESFSDEWGPKAVRTMAALRAQLKLVQRDGYIVQEEEAIPGLSSVAGPIHDGTGAVVAALNVAVASARYDRDRIEAELLSPVLDACKLISRRLGG